MVIRRGSEKRKRAPKIERSPLTLVQTDFCSRQEMEAQIVLNDLFGACVSIILTKPHEGLAGDYSPPKRSRKKI